MNWPLMRNNIPRGDLYDVCSFLGMNKSGTGELYFSHAHPPKLTNGDQVLAFESEFAQWLGCKYAVMVNSGSSANLITMAALRGRTGGGEIIVPTVTWVSDIASVIHAGFQPVFVDIDPLTLGMDWEQVYKKITKNTKAVFVTHVLGFNAIYEDTRARLAALHIELIEDCCEALGATMNAKKLGTFGLASNFSFYYAHHMSTIEGGMVCTDNLKLYNALRLFRSHGMTREGVPEFRADIERANNSLNPDFIFAVPGYNVRSTEINAVIGRSQLKRLDANNDKRSKNLEQWLDALDGSKYFIDYRREGSSNYALPLVLTKPDLTLLLKVLKCLEESEVEYRQGTAGGGNQLRQPYLRWTSGDQYLLYPQADHVHFYGLYIGNYPELKHEQIEDLCQKLNAL